MNAPPGMGGSPPGMPAQQFQAPPGVNFNAPVIRMGGDQQGKPDQRGDRMGGDRGVRGSNAEPLGRNRMGLGAERDHGGGRNLDAQRAAVRESMAAMTPPTREEVARTIFIGGIGEGAPDDDKIEEVLRCAGKLRRWNRARDATDKKCKFGFAEYEDVDSLDAANEIFGKGIEVPVFGKAGGVEREEDDEVKKMKLLVVVDDQSKKYISEWKGKQGEQDDARQFRLESCRDELQSNFAAMVNQAASAANAVNGDANVDGDAKMADANGENVENVAIRESLEDELSDLPENIRATVAAEIRAFRDRSRRRDLENFRQEEEATSAARVNRLASPPPGASANGIPVGPRDRSGVQGAPSGPKGFRGAQLPNDYANGVNFVSANGANGYAYNREDDEADESDEELERRRQAKRDAELERQYAEAERRWVQREKNRASAQERERVRETAEKRELERQKDAMAARLREWDDDEEARLARDDYYRDHSAWLRQRQANREREQREDDRDRAAEEQERAEERRREAEAKGMADDFFNQMDMEVSSRAVGQGRQQQQQQPPSSAAGGFKMSLGSAAQRAAKPERTAPRRAMADVENLLEDEDDAAASGVAKRPELKPLTDTSTIPLNSVDMSDAELAAAKKELASSIPSSTEELFAYPVKFNYLTSTILTEQIKPFVEKKVVESLGVQEDLLVDAVVEALKERKEAREVVGELEDALEEEAEGLVRKVWRMVVFLTECEGRGLS